MNVTGLLYAAVRGFRGPAADDSNGATGLAPFMDMSATSLSHKVSPAYTNSHCSPEEVVQICKLTGDAGAVRAMALELGYALLPIAPVGEGPGGSQFMAGLAASIKEFGEFITESSSRAASNGISDNDMARIDREFSEHMAASAHLYSLIRQQHRDSRPATSAAPAPAKAMVPA